MTNHNEPLSPERDLPGPEPPRIYVASLSDNNNGHLHGTWLDAAREDEAVWADIHDMLAASPQPHAEGFAIHDHEGFAEWNVGEHQSISVLTAVARAIVEHGPAVTSWLA